MSWVSPFYNYVHEGISFYLDIEVNEIILMHVSQAIDDLTDVFDNLCFCHFIVIISDSIEELATRQAGKTTTSNDVIPLWKKG